MKIIERLQENAAKLKKYISALYYASQDSNVPIQTKLLVVFTVAYALSPIDLIPDFIPLLGYIDDLILLPLLISLCIRSIPKSILEESLGKAENNPLSLKKNWKAGVAVLFLWAILLAIVISKVF